MVVVVVRMMLSRRGGMLRLDLLDAGTVCAGVELRDVTVEREGLAGVAGGGRGQDAASEVTERGRARSGDLWCRCESYPDGKVLIPPMEALRL